MSKSRTQQATGNGWIKLHRTIMDWEWYQDHNTTRLFIHLLLKANHKPNKWRGKVVDTGTVITGRKALASETGLTEQQVRYSLTKLKRTSNITIKTTNKYSIIEVKSWDDYQESNQQNPQSLTNNEPTSNQQVTTNKNVKNDKKVFVPPSTDAVKGYIIERGKMNTSEAERFCDFYASKGWMVGKNKMKDWKAAVRNWEKGNASKPETTSKDIDSIDDLKKLGYSFD
jgi:hypothetical protein